MKYNQEAPHPSLKDYLRCYWWLDNTSAEDLHFTIFPDGCFDLIIVFQNYEFRSISLTGLWSKDVEVLIQPNTQLIGIQFRLLAADELIQQSIAHLYNHQMQLPDDFWGLQTISFHDQSKLVARLTDFFLERIKNFPKKDPRKKALFKLLYQTKGNQSIQEYASQVFWSSRQINRFFKKQFGLPLKVFCTILKCVSSFKHLKEGQLYPTQNYFDRSHFTKEIKKYTKHTPKSLFENKNDRFLQLSILPKK